MSKSRQGITHIPFEFSVCTFCIAEHLSNIFDTHSIAFKPVYATLVRTPDSRKVVGTPQYFPTGEIISRDFTWKWQVTQFAGSTTCKMLPYYWKITHVLVVNRFLVQATAAGSKITTHHIHLEDYHNIIPSYSRYVYYKRAFIDEKPLYRGVEKRTAFWMSAIFETPTTTSIPY